jgi:cyclohexyl-isocyanide hydratase
MSLEIGILVFPKVQPLDLIGPHEVFASIPGAKLHLIWKNLSPITAATGLVLTPTTTLEDCPALDVLCVPGGAGVNALMTDDEILDFLRTQCSRVRYLTSVCTGSLVLGAAGLLKGRRATTHWASHDFLAKLGAIPTQGRVVRDGNVFTAGGVTAGIDFGLTIAAELVGEEAAQEIQLGLEYAPEPPFRAGTPEAAPAAVLATVTERLAPMTDARRAIIDGLSSPNRDEALRAARG